MRRIRRTIQRRCTNCLGGGQIITGNGREACGSCNGTGEVESVVWEIVHEEEDDHAHAIGWAGSLE